MDGTEILFGPLLRALPAAIEPEVVTYPETGPNRYEDLLPAVIERVRSGRDCILLGWSFSGPLALRVAVCCPDRVRGVILAATFVTPPIRWLVSVRQLVRGPTFFALRVLRRLPIWLLRHRDDPLRRDKAAIWQRVPAHTLAARARAILAVDVRDELRRCPCPVLYLAASDDRVVPPRNAAEVRAVRPAAETATIAGGHFALYSAADAGAAAIGEFAVRCLADRVAAATNP